MNPSLSTLGFDGNQSHVFSIVLSLTLSTFRLGIKVPPNSLPFELKKATQSFLVVKEG